MLGGFVEAVDVHVADARLDQEVDVDAVPRNFVANQRELHRLFDGFARDADVNRGALGSLQQVGDVARAHVLGRFAVDGNDHVARMNAGLVGRRPGEGIDHDDFVVARADGHAHAVVLAALVFAHQRIRLGIEEIRVRIERVQHARDRPVVDSFVRIHRLGVIVFDERVHIGELLQAVLDVRVAGHRRLLAGALGEHNSQKSAGKEKKNYEEE